MRKFAIAVVIILSVLMCFSPSFAARKALLIGINDYQALPSFSRQGISDLRGCINDVTGIRMALISYYGFTEKDIRVLVNDRATKQEIRTTFDEWLVNGTKAGDTVFLYFSGHGSTVPDHNGDEENGVDEVLCPHDMVPQGGYNIILDDELALWLTRLNGRRVVVISDSCHSGGQTRSIREMPVTTLEDTPAWRARFISITDYQPSSIARGRSRGADISESVIFMAASREDEIAIERNFSDGFHGGFTFGLCDGMKASPTSSYEDLFEHAKKVVIDRLELAQEPQLISKRDIAVEPFLGGVTGSVDQPEQSSQPAVPSGQESSQDVTPLEEDSSQPVTPSEHAPGQPVVCPEPVSTQPVILPEHPSTQPVCPPEIVGKTVLVAIDNLGGCNRKEMEELREGLSGLSIADVVKSDEFFDRLVRGEKKNGRYYVRLINGIGDVETLKPAPAIDKLVKNLNDHLEYAFMVKQLGRIHHPSPPFKIKAWVTDENRRDFRLGENIVFGIKSERDCYVLLINLDSMGNFHIIYPNKYHHDNFVRANTTVLIPDKTMSASEFQLQFGPPAGEETVKLIATTEPLNLRNLGLGDFRDTFQTISGRTRAIFVKGVLNNLSSNRFVWSEDTVVIRSHQVEKP